MEKKYKVHIVPQQGQAKLPALFHSSNDMIKVWTDKLVKTIGTYSDIIITDPEAEKGEGDTYMYNDGGSNDIRKCIRKEGNRLYSGTDTFAIEDIVVKAIASTNPDHNLPQLTPQDIQYIIDSSVEEVELEMEEIRGEKETESISYGETTIHLDVTPGFYTPLITDNCIKIVRPQQVETVVESKTYTETDMITVYMRGIPKNLWQTTYKDIYQQAIDWLKEYNQSK